MKKIFGMLSLIAILMVAFTSQAVALDEQLNVECVSDYDGHDSVTMEFTTTSEFNLPFEVGWTNGSSYNIIFNSIETTNFTDAPFEVGWTTNISNINDTISEATNFIDIPFEVGWTE